MDVQVRLVLIIILLVDFAFFFLPLRARICAHEHALYIYFNPPREGEEQACTHFWPRKSPPKLTSLSGSHHLLTSLPCLLPCNRRSDQITYMHLLVTGGASGAGALLSGTWQLLLTHFHPPQLTLSSSSPAVYHRLRSSRIHHNPTRSVSQSKSSSLFLGWTVSFFPPGKRGPAISISAACQRAERQRPKCSHDRRSSRPLLYMAAAALRRGARA